MTAQRTNAGIDYLLSRGWLRLGVERNCSDPNGRTRTYRRKEGREFPQFFAVWLERTGANMEWLLDERKEAPDGR